MASTDEISSNKVILTGAHCFCLQAYLEFFCCEEDAQNLLEVLKHYPVVGYHFVNASVCIYEMLLL